MRRIVVTDLDGTLLNSSGEVSAGNIRALRELGREGVIRVVATGRSAHSAGRAVPRDLPVDFIVFSSGLNVVETATGRVVEEAGLSAPLTRIAGEFLQERGLDFMVHDPLPENHRFRYFRNRGEGSNPDFDRRIARYAEFAVADTEPDRPVESSQLLAVCPRESGQAEYEAVREGLGGHHVVRTTSPMDHQSVWIEVFPYGVNKGSAVGRIMEYLGTAREGWRCLAVGNDYNDLELLRSADLPRVVGNAPEELRALYPEVGHHDRDGFAEAVREWTGG